MLAGLTGGIASGKNSVAGIMSGLGARIVDADAISRELVVPHMPAWHEIINEFGDGILDSKDNINRKALGRIIFQNKKKREILNKILHPRIIKEEERRIEALKKSHPHSIIIVNAALLIESGNYKNVDKVIVVSALEPLVIKRIMDRDSLTRDEILSRIRSQCTLEEKLEHADYVIDNNGTFEELRDKAESLFNELARVNSQNP